MNESEFLSNFIFSSKTTVFFTISYVYSENTKIKFHMIVEWVFNGEIMQSSTNYLLSDVAFSGLYLNMFTDDYVIYEWVSQQLIDHPFQQVFEPCFKMFMAYEHNCLVMFSDGHLTFESTFVNSFDTIMPRSMILRPLIESEEPFRKIAEINFKLVQQLTENFYEYPKKVDFATVLN